MRVLVIATWFPGEHNPAEAPFNLDHVRALEHAGHTVSVIHVRLAGRHAASTLPLSGKWEGVQVSRIALSPLRPFRAARTQWALIHQLARADVLHTMAFSSILTVMFPWLLRRAMGRAPVWVHTEHWTGALDPASVSPLWRRLAGLRRIYRLPHQVTGVGPALVEAIRPFARANAVSIVPCVVRCVTKPRDAQFGTPLKLVAVGALLPRKRPQAAISTVQWLQSSGYPAELTWVGDGPLREACEEQVRRMGLQGSIQFAGSVEPRQVGSYLESADLFLLPSAHETFFASAAEAIGAGRAVVICDLPGLGDFLTPHNSVLVDGADPALLGQAVMKAATQFGGVEAEHIAEPIRRHYSLDAVSVQFSSVYAKAFDGAR